MRRVWVFLLIPAWFVFVSSLVNAQWNVWPIPGTGTGVGMYTSLELDSQNNPRISYQDYTNGWLLYAYWAGSAWVYDTVDQAGGVVGKYSSLELDTLERPHIAYYADIPTRDLKYAYWDGAAWVVTTVDAGRVTDTDISLVLEPGNNHRHISYCKGDSLWYAYYDGVTWQTWPVDVNPFTGRYSSIDLDPTNNYYPCISHVNAVNTQLIYVYYDGATWQSSIIDNTQAPQYTSLDVDPTGVAHIAYSRQSPNPPFPRILRYAWGTPGSWSTETVPYAASTNYGSFPSLRADIGNNPRISFSDDFNDDLLYAAKNGAWTVDSVDVLGQVGQYTSLALENQSCPHISYYDAGNGQPKYAFKSCLDIGPESILSPADTVPPGSNIVQVRVRNYGNAPSTPCSAHCWVSPGTYSEYTLVDIITPGGFRDVSFLNWVETNRGTYDMCVATLMLGDNSTGNDTLCEPIVVAIHDCGTDTIVSPPDRVLPGSTVPVRAWVQNYGDYQDTFTVRCWSTPAGGYLDMQMCVLAPGADSLLQFADWVAPGVEYTETFCCSTQVPGDGNNANDRFCKDVEVAAVHDGGVEAILNPPDWVDPIGGPQPVQAQVRNYGSITDDIPVLCRIGAAYTARDTVFAVPGGAAATATFPNWNPGGGFGPWTMTCSTYVALDTITGNDALSKTIYAYVHDCGADTILVPPQNAQVGTPYNPQVVIQNYGDLTEAVQVRCQIDGYDQTVVLPAFGPGVVDTVLFPVAWTPSGAGNYLAKAWTQIAGDRDATNDTTYKNITVTGVEEIPAAPAVPRSFELSQNLPNPFGHHTSITFGLPVSGQAALRVYDLTGSLVRTLVDRVEQPGYHTVAWDGRDEKGLEVSSGIYFYRFSAGDFTITRKLAVMR